MKLAVFSILVSTALAFTPPSMTFAVGKKAPAKKAAPVKKATVAVKKAAPKPKAAVKKAAPKPKAAVKKAAPKPKAAAKKVVKKVVKKVEAKKAPPKPKPTPKKVVKKAVRAAPKPVRKPVAAYTGGSVPSAAIPYETAPALLDGSLIGDVGFDPCYLSTKADGVGEYFSGLFGGNAPNDGLLWYREAELMHGRICMVAVVGFIAPGFGTFGGNEWTDSFGFTNPLEAISGAPSASLFQIFAFMSAMELRRISIILEDGPNYVAGNAQRWGQGGFNPFGFNYTPEEYAEKQLQEIKHARLAMVALLGLIFQANASGVGVVDQLSAAFVYPDYVAKAGYFFPEGI